MTIEEFYIGYLTDRLTVPVSGTIRHPMPGSFVTVEKVGGGYENKTRSALLAIQCWARSRAAAAALCEAVEAIMDGSVADDAISRCRLNSSYDFTDTAMKRYRYQAVFDITHFVGG